MRPFPKATSNPQISPQSLSFDFDLSGELIASNELGADLLADLGLAFPNWDQFRTQFANRFPDLPFDLDGDAKLGIIVLTSSSIADPMELEFERHKKGVTICLRTDGTTALSTDGDLHIALSSLNDLDLIRAVSEHAPFPVWLTLPDGGIGWSNERYKTLDAQIVRSSGDPLAPLFQMPDAGSEPNKAVRVSLKDNAHNRTYWFDVSRTAFKDGFLNFAVDIHAVVNAESAQRNFVQTLAKTFAHLATGLAIFDRNRQLVLFNPSLIDLTELRPDFLTARPNLFSFFDQLRDNQVMPEPKNYANWRERIADVVTAASDDNFSEIWHLPNGLTYRVTGRPHPDGAIAFLFEDISAEISLTRRFRAEADVTRSALDALDEGIAIFNAAGVLQQSNRAMVEFSGLDEGGQINQMTVHDITRVWQARCRPSPAWGEVRDFICGETERETWNTELRSKDGHPVKLQVSPLASGATLVTVSQVALAPAMQSKKRSPTFAA
ncbi:MAG: PAS-domain containing protein [Planktotalea sp.]|uniref:PAS-domain containing protein n=1 Tax=Planktotalea sp. TaxID=2029877 RepID=UPI003C7548C8